MKWLLDSMKKQEYEDNFDKPELPVLNVWQASMSSSPTSTWPRLTATYTIPQSSSDSVSTSLQMKPKQKVNTQSSIVDLTATIDREI